MSQQHGVPPTPASIETAPPTHGTSSTTSGLHTSAPTVKRVPESSSLFLSSRPSRPPSTISSKVHIPKLSPATTELVARVTGHRKGEQQRNGTKFVTWNPPSLHPGWNYPRTQPSGTMKTSSTIIELPTAPFVCSNHMTTPGVAEQATTTSTSTHAYTSTFPQGSHERSTDLVNIAPKPAEHPSIEVPIPPQNPLPSQPSPVAQAAKDSPPSALRKRAAVGPGQRRSTTDGTKRRRRRRGNDSDGEDIVRAGDSSSEESDVAPTATQTKSGRQVNRPSLYMPSSVPLAVAKDSSNSLETSDHTQRQPPAARKRKRVYRKPKDGNVTCIHCQRGHGPPSNAIVFCDECNGPWHQLCHDPPIDPQVITVKEREWICRECKPMQVTIIRPMGFRNNSNLTGSLIGPPLHAPVTMPKMDVGGEGYSADERRGFLSGLSHATLVELLVTLSDQHPTIPMFPQSLRTLQSRFSFKPTKVAPTPSSTSTNTPMIANTLNHALTSGVDVALRNTGLTPEFLPTPSSAQPTQHDDPSEESEYEIEEHRLYPRAGNGFRLSKDASDLDILQEEVSCRTFSYALHGPAQARAQANEPAPVWGSWPSYLV